MKGIMGEDNVECVHRGDVEGEIKCREMCVCVCVCVIERHTTCI